MFNADDILIGAAELFVDGVNVGWTKGGTRLRTNKSYWYKPSLKGLGEEEAVKESEAYFVATVLSEATIENLKIAWGISESIDTSVPMRKRLDFGGSNTVTVHVLRFSSGRRRVVFYRVVAMDFGEHGYFRDNETLMPVTFRVLLDTTKNVGYQVGYFQDGFFDQYNNFLCRVTVTS